MNVSKYGRGLDKAIKLLPNIPDRAQGCQGLRQDRQDQIKQAPLLDQTLSNVTHIIHYS